MKTERPYRLKASGWFSANTYTTEAAAREAVYKYVKRGQGWKIERRLGSRHSRKYELVAEGVRE